LIGYYVVKYLQRSLFFSQCLSYRHPYLSECKFDSDSGTDLYRGSDMALFHDSDTDRDTCFGNYHHLDFAYFDNYHLLDFAYFGNVLVCSGIALDLV